MKIRPPLGTLFGAGAERLQLKYFMFDWDDNILHMPTRIHMDKRVGSEGWQPCAVSTAEFARIRHDVASYRPRGGSWDLALADFYDHGPRGADAFVLDVQEALAAVQTGRERPAPSFEKFKAALVESRLFAIVTARSNGSRAIRRGVECFIANALTDEQRREMIANQRGFMRYFDEPAEMLSDADVLRRYLDLNHYSGVSSPEFQQRMGRDAPAAARSPEEGKQYAIREFVRHIVILIRGHGARHDISVGFSDDDVGNVRAVESFLREELARALPDIRFVVYDTSEAGAASGRKIVINHATDPL